MTLINENIWKSRLYILYLVVKRALETEHDIFEEIFLFYNKD